MEKRFYVYEYFIVDTEEIFYVGKGTGKRFKQLNNRSEYFKSIHSKYECGVRIVYTDLTNEESCEKERQRIKELKDIGMARANFTEGGTGFSTGKMNPTHLNPHYGDRNGMRTKNIDFSGEKNPFYGKTHSEETKQKISENRKGKGGRSGSENPMYENHRFAGEKNPMYGKKGFDHPNSRMFKVTYLDETFEFLTSSQCEKKFGIAFIRIKNETIGVISYKKKSINSKYEGTVITQVEKNIEE